jgi:hypothetical protein
VVLLVAWLVVVLALVVLGVLAYGVLGALRRLGREVEAVDREVRPLLERAQQTAARAAAAREAQSSRPE